MKDSEKIRILDDVILDLEINQEKAAVMADEIVQGYFCLDDDESKLYSFSSTEIEFNILQDYIIRMGEKLQEVRKTLREWHRLCEEKGGVV